jgi:hypothetical protein
MRIRVRVDIRQPLKKESRVKNQGGSWCTVNFKYEKLGVFCFVCGIIGHGENRCAVRFSMTEDDGLRAWSKELRAELRRRGGRQTSRWLTEEDGGRNIHGSSQSHGPGHAQVNHTRQSNHVDTNQPIHSTINQHSLLCSPLVPLINPNGQELAHMRTNQPAYCPAFTASLNQDANQRMILETSPTHQPAQNQQPLLILNDPDSSIISQSLPHKNQPTSSYTISPIINDALKIIPSQQFSFNATIGPNPNQHTNSLTRPIKNNPNQKLTRTGPARTGPKQDLNRPKTNPNQSLTETMEVQTEKKRRRDNEKEKEDDSSVIQHFLTAGPGSQACRDQ